MVYNSEKHHRRSIRLKEYDYSSPGWYFITLCSQDREFLFGDIKNGKMILNDYGKIVSQIWNNLPVRYPIKIDENIIMPNHFHGIINIVGVIHESPQPESPQPESSQPESSQPESPQPQLESSENNSSNIHLRRKMLLPKIIGYLKMNSAKQINLIRKTQGSPVWQRDYYEHIIRNEKSLNRIRNYIINNPGK